MSTHIEFFATSDDERRVLDHVLVSGDVVPLWPVVTPRKQLAVASLSDLPPWPKPAMILFWLRRAGPLQWITRRPRIARGTSSAWKARIFAQERWDKIKPRQGTGYPDTDRSPVIYYQRGVIEHGYTSPSSLLAPPPSLAKVSRAYERWVGSLLGWVRHQATPIQALGRITNLVPNFHDIVNAVFAMPEALEQIRRKRKKYAIFLADECRAARERDLDSALKSKSPGHRRQAIHMMVEQGMRRSVPRMVPFLKDKNNAVRSAAAWALWRLGCKSFGDSLMPLLDDRSRDVAMYAALALAAHGTMVHVREVARRHQAPRSDLLEALARRGVADPATAQLKSKYFFERAEAAKCLGLSGARDAAGLLRPFVDHRDAELRAASRIALLRLEGKQQALPVAALLDDDACSRHVPEMLALLHETLAPKAWAILTRPHPPVIGRCRLPELERMAGDVRLTVDASRARKARIVFSSGESTLAEVLEGLIRMNGCRLGYFVDRSRLCLASTADCRKFWIKRTS